MAVVKVSGHLTFTRVFLAVWIIAARKNWRVLPVVKITAMSWTPVFSGTFDFT